MGLDIYVRWGVEFDEDGDCLDFPREARKAQLSCAYGDAPEVGYMRYNWTGVSGIGEVSKQLNAPNPIIDVFPAWEGWNGEDLSVTAAEMERLSALRANMSEWIHKTKSFPVVSFGNEVPADLLTWFVGKLNSTITLISFIEQHKDKPGLRIEFN